MPAQKSYVPTKKWFASLVTGLATVAAVWIESGQFDDTEEGMIGTLALALLGAYIKRNDATPAGDGVPAS